ncbi:probable galacturonosyltransferase 6 isoform X1 [Rhodamnia argentea]|uniref:Hexosyltransferase n=1 Tax=Rhodamnia argentea TaxID=178133 RepID=A0A8B8QRZ4_9MYRT|nr:probable galacturonosyltransferase 6 isoform X1 [Rhodamnia argentea]
MKRLHRRLRILILSLFSVSVLAPVVLVSFRLKHISPTGRREFLEEFSSRKFSADVWRLNSVDQEEGEGLKEPKQVIYEDNKFVSTVSYSSNNIHHSAESRDAAERTQISERNGTTRRSAKEDEQIQHREVPSTSRGQEKLDQIMVQRVQNGQHREQSSSDKKVKEVKDQLIRAKVYLNFAPPGSNSHMVKELRLRMKELERAMGDAKKDSDLSRRAWQRTKAMEVSLIKASRTVPDCSSMATKLRAMTYNTEEQVQAHKNEAEHLIQLAARTTPKGLHCLAMRLTSEYFTLPAEERKLGNQEKARDGDLYHYAVFSDNILACAVVVNSTVAHAAEPEKIVFHVVTDSLNFPAISMWFLQNPPGRAAVDIQSLENFEWLLKKYASSLQKQNAHDPRYNSALNHLRFYLPDVFPLLDKIVFLDHDVVVQRDLTKLWDVNLKGKVNGAVETCQEGDASYRRMDMYVDFTDPFVSEWFNANTCTWAFGMNLFDLQEWRKQNLTAKYGSYLQLLQEHGNPLWKAGTLPIGWLTFYNQTVALDRRWHILGLGYESNVAASDIDRAAVIHFDGVMKPWLEIGIRKYKGYWTKHVMYDHPHLQQCNVHE